MAQYKKRGFKINVILGDPEFKSIKDQLNKLFGIALKITSKVSMYLKLKGEFKHSKRELELLLADYHTTNIYQE